MKRIIGSNKYSNINKILLNVFAFILFAITFIPFYMMLVSSLKHQMQIYMNPWFLTLPIHFDNYVKAVIEIYKPIFNSLVIALISISVTLVSSLTAAYSFARYKFPFKKFLYMSIIAILMVPGFVILITQFVQMVNMGLYNTYLGQAIPPAAGFTAMGVMLMRTYFEGLPKSLFEAADIEGASDFSILTMIVMPMSVPIIATVSIISGLSVWNNFTWSLVITRGDKVMPVVLAIINIKADINEGDGMRLAGYITAAIPILILFITSTKSFVSGLSSGAIKG
jgi:ABC-type glycerol-3-phosphate transport system permease component